MSTTNVRTIPNCRVRFVPQHGHRLGFSLVEVLVAIAILTVGIVAFLQIFPLGYFALQVAANTASADRLAQAELNRLTNGHGAQISEIGAIYSEDPTTGFVTLDPNFQPDKALTPSAHLTLATSTGFNIKNSLSGALPGGQTALATEPYAYIAGETVRVPVPTPQTGATAQSDVLLDYGPIVMSALSTSTYPYPVPGMSGFNSLNPDTHPSFYVHGTAWTGKLGNSGQVTPSAVTGGASTFTNPLVVDDPEIQLTQDAPAYLIDYNAGAVALHQPSDIASDNNGYPQLFTMQVTDSDPAAVEPKTVVFEADWAGGVSAMPSANHLSFWDSTNKKPQWVSLVGGAVKALDGSNLVAPFKARTDLVVRDFNEVSTFDSDPYEFMLGSSLGTAGSNVYLGALQFSPRAGRLPSVSGQPLQARVDYIVQDWHTIHEDRTVGTQSNTQGNTSTVRLTLNHLLQAGFRDDQGTRYVGIGSTTGAATTSSILVFDTDEFQALNENTDYTVDYANGAVTIKGVPTGTHVRIYYHPTYAWGIATIKSAAYYVIDSTATNGVSTTPSSLGHAVLDNASGGSYKLYFPQADVGQMVQVNGTVTYHASAGTTSLTTPIQTLQPLTIKATQTGVVPFVDLTQFVPSGATLTTANVNASGASLTVRVVWQQRGLWRHRDATTVATAQMT